MLGGWGHRTSHRAAMSAPLAWPPRACTRQYARESVRRRKRSGYRPQAHPTGRPLSPCPQANPFGPKISVGHFQYDAANVLVGEEVIASKLLLVQHALHVDEEGVTTPARKEAILSSLRHPCVLPR